MSPAPSGFVGREKAAYTTIDDKLFVFGGQDAAGNALGDAALYDPARDTWTLVTAIANAPSPRRLATAVSAGDRILVVGGRSEYDGLGFVDGASFDPSTGEWSTIADAPVGRVGAIGAASSSHAVFWQGWAGTGTSLLQGAERYSVETDSWEAATSAPYAPTTLDHAAWASAGASLYLFGANGGTAEAWSFGLTTNSWTMLPTDGTTARSGSFGAWDGYSFFAWGGRDATGAADDGWYYYGGFWAAMGGTGRPTARSVSHRETGWALVIDAGDIVFLGGFDTAGTALMDGGRFHGSPTSGAATWTSISEWPSGEQHLWGVAASAGGEVLVWGGRDGLDVTATGDRWAP